MNAASHDTTGRERLVRNLISRWLVQFVVIVSGFVIPRLIDTNLGKEQLGVWDFGWTVVSYCRFFGFGMAGSLSRFVALNVGSNDRDALAQVTASTVAIQILVASATLLVAAVVGFSLASILPTLDPSYLSSAQWCVVFLGGTIAVRMLAWPARGVLSGRHYWSTNSYVTIFGDVLALIAMILVLKLNPSLSNLALAYLLTTSLTESIRYFAARRVHDAPIFEVGNASWSAVKDLFVFGVKTNVVNLSGLIVAQTTALALAIGGGPATLAVFARAAALQRHTQLIVRSFAELLTPTAASLQGMGEEQELRRLYLDSMKTSTAMSIPLFMLLAFAGNDVLRLWMGENYVLPYVLLVLCVGSIVPVSQSAAISILAGLNRHGMVAVRALIASSAILVVTGGVAFYIGWSPLVAAIVTASCLTFGYGLAVYLGSVRIFDVSHAEYFREVLKQPLVINGFILLLLILGDQLGANRTMVLTFAWTALAGLVTLVCYWVWLLPQSAKDRLLRRESVGATHSIE